MPRSAYDVEFYEGLVRKTAGMYAKYIEDEYEDIVAVLRIKVWRALVSYDPARAGTLPVERYVFNCLRNQVKDLLKRKHRNELYIEDFRTRRKDGSDQAVDSFDGRYLAITSDEALSEAELDQPLIPSTLTAVERQVLALLYADYSQRESATRLGLTCREVERAARGIRQKMADWRPVVAPTPVAPTPVAA